MAFLLWWLTCKLLSNRMEENNADDFIAVLTYYTEEQGGRHTPAKSGYRPQVKFPFSDMQTSGQQIFIGKDIVSPGETMEARMKILSPEFFAGCLTEGMEFEFREGQNVIGTGKIKQIINEKLRKQASEQTNFS
jgi:translation elongation factor EF-Tu-like GTPase